MMAFGNDAANTVWEAAMPTGQKPDETASREVMETFIRQKYMDKAFLDAGAGPADGGAAVKPELRLYDALRGEINHQKGYAALVACTKAELNTGLPGEEAGGFTVLHLAAAAGSQRWVQLLLWGGADPNALDDKSCSPLHYARLSKEPVFVDCVSLLLAAECKGPGPGSSQRRLSGTSTASPSGSPDHRDRSGTVWDRSAPLPAVPRGGGAGKKAVPPHMVRPQAAPATPDRPTDAGSAAATLGTPVGKQPGWTAKLENSLAPPAAAAARFTIPSPPQQPPTATDPAAIPATTTGTTNADIDVRVKVLLREDQIKLWLPPYSTEAGESTITVATVATIATRVRADTQAVSTVLEKLRVKAIAKKTPEALRKTMPGTTESQVPRSGLGKEFTAAEIAEALAPQQTEPQPEPAVARRRQSKPTNPFDRHSLVGSEDGDSSPLPPLEPGPAIDEEVVSPPPLLSTPAVAVTAPSAVARVPAIPMTKEDIKAGAIVTAAGGSAEYIKSQFAALTAEMSPATKKREMHPASAQTAVAAVAAAEKLAAEKLVAAEHVAALAAAEKLVAVECAAALAAAEKLAAEKLVTAEHHAASISVESALRDADLDTVWASALPNDGVIAAANAANALKLSGLDTKTLRSVWTAAKKTPGGAAGKGVMNRLEFNVACKLAVGEGGSFTRKPPL
jgi:hypothetical protein